MTHPAKHVFFPPTCLKDYLVQSVQSMACSKINDWNYCADNGCTDRWTGIVRSVVRLISLRSVVRSTIRIKNPGHRKPVPRTWPKKWPTYLNRSGFLARSRQPWYRGSLWNCTNENDSYLSPRQDTCFKALIPVEASDCGFSICKFGFSYRW